MEFPKMNVELFPKLEEKLEKNKYYHLQYKNILDYSKVLTKYVYSPTSKKEDIEKEIIGDMCRLLLQEKTYIEPGNKKLNYEVNLEKKLEFQDLKFPGNIFQKGIELDTQLYIFIVLKLLYQRSLHKKNVLEYLTSSDKEIKNELYNSIKNSSNLINLQKIIRDDKKYTELVRKISKNIHWIQLITKQTTFNGEIKLKLVKLHCKLENLKLEDFYHNFAFYNSKNEYDSELKIYPNPQSNILDFEINLTYVFYLSVSSDNCQRGILSQDYSSRGDFSDLGIINLQCLQYKVTYHIKLVLNENVCSLNININLDKLFGDFTCIKKPFLILHQKGKSKLSKKTKKKSRSSK